MIIIFTGGEHPTAIHTNDFLQNLQKTNSANNTFCTKGTPYIIAADSGLLFCTECGYNPDIICGDFDSLPKTDTAQIFSGTLKKYPNTIIQQWPKDKDYTDTQIALQKAIKYNEINKRHHLIVLVGGDGGRTDHFLANLKIFEHAIAPDYWLCKEQFIQLLLEPSTYEVTDSSEFSIFPIFDLKNETTYEYKIQSTNLVWALDTVKWNQGMYSLSNRIKNTKKQAQLVVKKGKFLFLAPYSELNNTL